MLSNVNITQKGKSKDLPFFAVKYLKVVDLDFMRRLDIGCLKLHSTYVKYYVDHDDSMWVGGKVKT